MIKRRKWDNWLSQNSNCIEISTCLPAFIYINVNLTRITGVVSTADIAGKRTYTNMMMMLDWTGDNLVPGVLSPYDVGKLSLPLVLRSDWSISISLARTVCQEGVSLFQAPSRLRDSGEKGEEKTRAKKRAGAGERQGDPTIWEPGTG